MRSNFRATMEQYGLVPDRGVIALLVTLTAVWLIVRLGGEALMPIVVHLIATPVRAIGPEPWQLVTSMFFNGRLSNVAMTAITLLFFGNLVERQLGARGVWKVFVAGGFAGTLLGALVGRLLSPHALIAGSWAAATAMLTAFAASAGNLRLSFFGTGQMRPATMAWIWLGISVLFALVQIEDVGWRRTVVALCELAGASGAGWIVGGRGRSRGSFDLGGSLDKLRMWRLKRRYRVLSGGRDSRDRNRYLN
jgi:membrane associated rhomboid family serine protease